MIQAVRRKPTSPGKILLHEFMKPQGISIADLAKRMKRSEQLVMKIINGEAPITISIACEFSIIFNVSPECWINLQAKTDKWEEDNPGCEE